MPDLEAYVLNTGRIGGEGEGSKDVRIPDSSAIVEAIVRGTIEWEHDPDFGYEVASSVPGIEDEELLQPRRLYDRQGRGGEYEETVARLEGERVEYLKAFPTLDHAVVEGLDS
jgi:phosphoenolpyruvate carboxykinase (ATP)